MLIKMSKNKNNDFDYEDELKNINLIEYFKDGVISYIKRNNLQPKNRKELDKIIEDYGKRGSGGE